MICRGFNKIPTSPNSHQERVGFILQQPSPTSSSSSTLLPHLVSFPPIITSPCFLQFSLSPECCSPNPSLPSPLPSSSSVPPCLLHPSSSCFGPLRQLMGRVYSWNSNYCGAFVHHSLAFKYEISRCRMLFFLLFLPAQLLDGKEPKTRLARMFMKLPRFYPVVS